MELYLIRHGAAHPLASSDVQSDEDRALTDAGHLSVQALAAALQRHGVHLEQVVSSPLLRPPNGGRPDAQLEDAVAGTTAL